jgi:hypothetical protein
VLYERTPTLTEWSSTELSQYWLFESVVVALVHELYESLVELSELSSVQTSEWSSTELSDSSFHESVMSVLVSFESSLNESATPTVVLPLLSVELSSLNESPTATPRFASFVVVSVVVVVHVPVLNESSYSSMSKLSMSASQSRVEARLLMLDFTL